MKKKIEKLGMFRDEDSGHIKVYSPPTTNILVAKINELIDAYNTETDGNVQGNTQGNVQEEFTLEDLELFGEILRHYDGYGTKYEEVAELNDKLDSMIDNFNK